MVEILQKGRNGCSFGVGTPVSKQGNILDWIYITSIKKYTNIIVIKYHLTDLIIQFS